MIEYLTDKEGIGLSLKAFPPTLRTAWAILKEAKVNLSENDIAAVKSLLAVIINCLLCIRQ